MNLDHAFSSSWLFAFFAGSSLMCCSCTTMKSMARTEDFSEQIQQAHVRRAAVARASDPTETPGVVRLARNDSRIQQVSHQEASVTPPEIPVCPGEPRLPVPGPDPYGVGMPLFDFPQAENPHHFPDEYLCDGGDRDWPVHYTKNERLGLDTEDTVIEYVDHRGTERVTPSNKVCVYAPRFAAVRTVSQPMLGEGLHKSVGMIHSTIDDELRSQTASIQKTKRDPAGNLRVRSRASGVDSEEIGLEVAQDLALVQHDKINNLFQSYSFTKFIDLEQKTAARLLYGLRAAVVWSREESPVITGQIEVPTEGLCEISATTLTVIDDLPSDVPGQLRLAKFADRSEAQPGDVITFTIRYQNDGPREVHYVRIVDNLTPRLEYLHESASSDRNGRLAVEDNGEGSLVLTFELADPLPPHATGTVTFQTRVR